MWYDQKRVYLINLGQIRSKKIPKEIQEGHCVWVLHAESVENKP